MTREDSLHRAQQLPWRPYLSACQPCVVHTLFGLAQTPAPRVSHDKRDTKIPKIERAGKGDMFVPRTSTYDHAHTIYVLADRRKNCSLIKLGPQDVQETFALFANFCDSFGVIDDQLIKSVKFRPPSSPAGIPNYSGRDLIYVGTNAYNWSRLQAPAFLPPESETGRYIPETSQRNNKNRFYRYEPQLKAVSSSAST